MNWKNFAKAIVDEVKAWADERFADVGKLKALVAAEVRELADGQRAAIAEQRKLEAKLAELAARPAPTVQLEGVAAKVTEAVDAWFKANPPPTPKDGTSVTVEDLQPFLQAGLAKWQLEFERNASGVLERFLGKLRQPEDGKPGRDATPEAIRAAVDAHLAEHPPAVPPPTAVQLRAAVDAYIAENPLPIPDTTELADELRELVGTTVAKWLEEHPPASGEPGPPPNAAEVDAAVLRYLEAHPIRAAVDAHLAEHPPAVPPPTAVQLRAAVDAYIAENPLPIPDTTELADELRELVGTTVVKWLEEHPPAIGEPGPPPKAAEVDAAVLRYLEAHPIRDGVDGKSITVEDVAPMLQGAFSEWALDFERRAAGVLERAVERMPKPKDGADGLNVSNFSAELEDDGRTVRLTLADGERRHTATVKLATILDRGVFKDGQEYERGDAVTFGGSVWIAQKDAPEGRPGNSPDWRLAVKKGRDGKRTA